MIKGLENYSELNFNFEYKNRIIKSTFDNNEFFKLDTPFLKVLKPIHISSNKKKNMEKKYIILEINENYNVNKELDDFLITINKLHETSQENIRKNSIKWFNTEFDDIGLDLKVKKPIDKQKDKQFIKILIPNDNNDLLEKIEMLEKNDYVMTNIFYRGLKVSNDHLMGEYELINLITQKEYEIIKKEENELIKEDINVNHELNENIIIDNVENNLEEYTENNIEEYEENNNDKILIEKNEELSSQKISEDLINEEPLKKNNKSEKVKNKNNNSRFIKIVTRKNKSLIFI